MDHSDGTTAVESHVGPTTHQIFPWVTRKRFDGEIGMLETEDVGCEIDKAEVVELNGVPVQVVVDYIKGELDSEESFLGLPAALFLWVVVSFCFMGHDRASVVRDCEYAIMSDIEENANFAFSAPGYMGFKGMADVNCFADFYSWFRLGILPLFTTREVVYSEDFNLTATVGKIPSWPSQYRERLLRNLDPMQPEEIPVLRTSVDRSHFLFYNRVIGGVRILQSSAVSSQCDNPVSAALAARGQCTYEEEGTTLNLNVEPELTDVREARGGVNDPNTPPTWFSLHDSQDTLLRKLTDLEDTEYFDWNTVRLEVQFLTYNAEYDLLTLTQCIFFQGRSGHLWKRIVHASLSMQSWYADPVLVIMDALFLIQMTYILVVEVREVWKQTNQIKTDGFMRCLQSYLGFWNIVDWISIGVAYVIAVLFVYVYQQTIDILPDLELVPGPDEATDFDLPFVDKIMDKVNDVAWVYGIFRYLASFYPMIIMMRLFKAFASQPRLAVVTNTLSAGAVDVAHFFLVFFAIFVTYAVMGNALFGRETDEFSTLDRSIDSCFQVLMGNFEMETFNAVGRLMAFLWFMSFMCLILLVMMNMLLAIVMDTYSEVKGSIEGSTTLFEQSNELFRRWKLKRKGLRTSLYTVLNTLEATFQPGHAKEIITTENLCRLVPQLPPVQAQRVLENSVAHFKVVQLADGVGSIGMQEMCHMIEQIDSELRLRLHAQHEGHGEQDGGMGMGMDAMHYGSFERSHSRGVDDVPGHPGQETWPPPGTPGALLRNDSWSVRRGPGTEAANLAMNHEVETLLRAARLRVVTQTQIRQVEYRQDLVFARVLCPLIEQSLEKWAEALTMSAAYPANSMPGPGPGQAPGAFASVMGHHASQDPHARSWAGTGAFLPRSVSG